MGRMDPWSPCSPPLQPVRRSSRAGRSGPSRSSGTACACSRTRRRAPAPVEPQRARDHPGVPGAGRAGRPAGRACSTARSCSWPTGVPSFAPSRSGCTCATRAAREALAAPAPGDVPRVRRAAARRRRPHAAHATTSAATRCPASSCPTASQLSPVYPDGAGPVAGHQAARARGRRRQARGRPTYQPGRRSPDWVKAPHRTHPRGARRRLARGDQRVRPARRGALRRPRRRRALRYLGRAGSGLTGRRAAELQRLLATPRADSPFDDEVPAVDARGTRWVEPTVVVDTLYLTRTPDRPAAPAGACGACAPTPTPTRGSSHDTRAPDGRRRGPAGAGEPPREGHVPGRRGRPRPR